MNTEGKYYCPICSKKLRPIKRYPKYICSECANQVCDKSGRSVAFSNIDMFGGLVGHYSDTKEKYKSQSCYIKDTKCKAEEARFGGVVIQIL
jgi:hypothetical protein